MLGKLMLEKKTRRMQQNMKQGQKHETEFVSARGSCTEPNEVIGGPENSANNKVSTPVIEKMY